jgi:tetraacyldisaccharide 4'-kinase
VNKFFNQLWYHRSGWHWLLAPLSGLYWLLVRIHRRLQPTPYLPPVPVIVVGNLSVGGTGKTPLCLALTRYFQAQGKKVVIISRGYRAQAQTFPLLVTADADAVNVGDEALLLAQQSGCPVVIDPQRARAARYAVDTLKADLLISDDGLQHHALGRHVEIVVVDGQRGFGNGWLLPAGPLRESLARLNTVDFVVSNGPLQPSFSLSSANLSLANLSLANIAPAKLTTMSLQPTTLVNLQSGGRVTVAVWQQQYGASTATHAVAGIGNPPRFFESLQALGFVIIPHAFADHHAYVVADLDFAGTAPVIMTAKDAVKCRQFASEHWWALEVAAELPPAFFDALQTRLEAN